MKFHNLGITEDVNMEVNMIEVSQETPMEVDDECQQEEYNKLVFPKEDETLMDFLHRFQRKNSEVMSCPLCSVVFEKNAVHNLEGVKKAKDKWDRRAPQDQRVFEPRRAFDPRRYFDPSIALVKLDGTRQRGPAVKHISFKPNAEASNGKWVKPTDGKKRDQGNGRTSKQTEVRHQPTVKNSRLPEKQPTSLRTTRGRIQ